LRSEGRAVGTWPAAAFTLGTQHLYRFVQGPVVAPLLFVGLIYFWLSPSIHFAAMLSLDRYQAMNWSMVIDGCCSGG
jgi:putative membrane protein